MVSGSSTVAGAPEELRESVASDWYGVVGAFHCEKVEAFFVCAAVSSGWLSSAKRRRGRTSISRGLQRLMVARRLDDWREDLTLPAQP